MNVWLQLQEAVDIFGLTALDRLFCFKIVRELQVSLRLIEWSNGTSPAKGEVHPGSIAQTATLYLMDLIFDSHYLSQILWYYLYYLNLVHIQVLF